MLRKEVCKQCRIDDYGEEKGWNDFAEAWFETNQYRGGHVFCPPNVTQAVNKSIAEKMNAVLTYEEQDLEAVKHILRKLLDSPCLQARSDIPAPWWCPRAAEHGVEK
jgi:hypothetical protein